MNWLPKVVEEKSTMLNFLNLAAFKVSSIGLHFSSLKTTLSFYRYLNIEHIKEIGQNAYIKCIKCTILSAKMNVVHTTHRYTIPVFGPYVSVGKGVMFWSIIRFTYQLEAYSAKNPMIGGFPLYYARVASYCIMFTSLVHE